MNRTYSTLLAIIIALCLVGTGWYIFRHIGKTDAVETLAFSQAALKQVPQYEADLSADTTPTYVHDTPPFSFKYPEDFSVGSFSDEIGEIVLVQRPNESAGVQIFIQKFPDTNPITIEQIMADIPSLPIADPKPIEMNGRQVGVSFVSRTDKEITREVWFAVDGYAYQMTATASFDSVLSRMLETWKVGKE